MTSSPSPPTPAPPRHADRVSLRRLFLGLAVLTLVFTAEKVVRLAAPLPLSQAPANLSVTGFQVRALPPQGSEPVAAPRRGRDLSHGLARAFQLTPLTGPSPLRLTLLPIRTRTGSEFSETTHERQGLTMVAVATEVPAFALKDRRLLTLSRGPSKGDELALGRGAADPRGRDTRLQTCLTPSGVAGVTASTLVGEGPSADPSATSSALLRRLLRLAGLEHSRYECLAIQLQGDDTNREQLVAAWKQLRTSLLQP